VEGESLVEAVVRELRDRVGGDEQRAA
jgi:hypothetical protein